MGTLHMVGTREIIFSKYLLRYFLEIFFKIVKIQKYLAKVFFQLKLYLFFLRFLLIFPVSCLPISSRHLKISLFFLLIDHTKYTPFISWKPQRQLSLSLVDHSAIFCNVHSEFEESLKTPYKMYFKKYKDYNNQAMFLRRKQPDRLLQSYLFSQINSMKKQHYYSVVSNVFIKSLDVQWQAMSLRRAASDSSGYRVMLEEACVTVVRWRRLSSWCWRQ